MQLNKKAAWGGRTHEGAPSHAINPEQALRRSVMGCMLFEKNAYENGIDIAERIKMLIANVEPKKVASLAIEAREKMGLRHVPLWMARCMAKLPEHKRYVSRVLQQIITRPDQLTDFVALYWKDGKEPLSAKVKDGLARSFTKFNEYQLAKYNRLDKQVKLRNVLFLCHAKPENPEQESLFRKLVNNELKTPDTWEVQLSAGKNKKQTFTDLMMRNKLGALAFIRNLRNMDQAGVDKQLITMYAHSVNVDKVFPYQLVAAAKEVPQFEPIIEPMLFRCLKEQPKIKGQTILLVDNSGSMHYASISERSKMSYSDAACALAVLARELFDDITVYGYGTNLIAIPPRRGFALRDAIQQANTGFSTRLGYSVKQVEKLHPNADRIIVFTDEQSHDPVRNPRAKKGYVINVANHQNGVGYGEWIHIDGFASSTLDWLVQYEREFAHAL